MNPLGLELTVLTAMIAPAVLISACGPLLLSTTIRFGRVVDRVRVLSALVEDLAHGRAAQEHAEEKISLYFDQLDAQSERARLLQRALRSIYSALGMFIAASLTIGLLAVAARRLDWIPVVIGLSGTIFLFYGAVLLIHESRLGYESMTHELDVMRKLVHRQLPAQMRELKQ
ncbi:MAG: DUF2721 domain-containing protein [Bryobacteraceae bacterium]